VAIGDSNHKGNVAELKIAATAAELGIGVYKPLTEHGRCDLCFDIGGQLLRIQCKWGSMEPDVIVVRTGGSYHSPTRGYVLSTYSADEVDAIAVYCGGNDQCYLLPIAEFEGLSYVHLRLAPTRNGQVLGVRMAADYQLGAVAQLAERSAGSRKAGGSNPPSSTQKVGPNHIGSQDLRRRLGHLTHRAAAGEVFHITRRGKPLCRLMPPETLLTREGGENSAPDDLTQDDLCDHEDGQLRRGRRSVRAGPDEDGTRLH
jgi:prevent-host-death family protein